MDVFFALAEPTRRSIIELLAQQGQMASSDIAKKFRSTPSAISQHLKILREAKLVRMQKKAQQRLYDVDPATLAQIQKWTEDLQDMWDKRFLRLDEVLKSQEVNHG